jgi:hypothetical protein
MTIRKPTTSQHHFSSETHACTRCGMSEEYFEDHGKPSCRGPTRDRTAQPLKGSRSAPG